MKPLLFIADLHLSDDTPELTTLLLQFLHDHLDDCAGLYILGDLFEAWVGDDDESQTAQQVAQALHAFSQYTAPVYFIAGNRDFLLGKAYAQRAGMTLLPNQYLVQYAGQTVLLTHGDEMCTDDVAYLRYRRIIRQKWLIALLLRLPRKKRQNIAASIRAQSRAKKQQKHNYQIADVTEIGVQNTLNKWDKAEAIIHGHTHRPDIHQHIYHNKTIARYVIADWHDGKGGYLRWDEFGIRSFSLPENPI